MKNTDAFQRAQVDADASFPLPKDSPGITAARFGVFATLCFFSFEILMPIVGFWWAEALSVALAALVGWAESTRKVRANTRAFTELFRIYSDHTKYDN